jgi:hypothetical protein
MEGRIPWQRAAPAGDGVTVPDTFAASTDPTISRIAHFQARRRIGGAFLCSSDRIWKLLCDRIYADPRLHSFCKDHGKHDQLLASEYGPACAISATSTEAKYIKLGDDVEQD